MGLRLCRFGEGRRFGVLNGSEGLQDKNGLVVGYAKAVAVGMEVETEGVV